MKMHSNEVEINEHIVVQLISSQFPQYSPLTVTPVLPSGTDNAIYRLGDELVVRLPRLAAKEKHIEKEYAWLPKLAPNVPLAIPTPVATGEPSNDYPFKWAIYNWLDGQPATESPPTDQSHAAEALADFIGALQKIDTAGAPIPTGDYDRGVSLIQRDIHTRQSILALKDMFDVKALTAEWDRALNSPPWDSRPVWIHGDLDGRNILTKDGRLSAVIDFGSLGVGDPAYDVMVAWKMFLEQARNIFRERLNVDEDTWVRSRGLALSQAVMILSYYTNENNPTLVNEARSWMRELGF